MVSSRRKTALFGTSLLAFSGCARVATPAPPADPPARAIEIAVEPKNPQASPDPGIWFPAPAQPVYRNPKIGVVYLRAYQDAQGRLFGPQVMYQVTDPGGWNVEAAQENGGYVSAANLETPPAPPSPRDRPSQKAAAAPSESPLLKPEVAARTVLTGLMNLEDRPEAEALAAKAGGGCTALFDEQAGWILVPPDGSARQWSN